MTVSRLASRKINHFPLSLFLQHGERITMRASQWRRRYGASIATESRVSSTPTRRILGSSSTSLVCIQRRIAASAVWPAVKKKKKKKKQTAALPRMGG
jgi:hypothetical protein